GRARSRRATRACWPENCNTSNILAGRIPWASPSKSTADGLRHWWASRGGTALCVRREHTTPISKGGLMVIDTKRLIAALAISVACTPAVLHAQEADADADAATSSSEPEPETVIVTGTRATGLDEFTTTSPVQVLSSVELQSAGRPDLMNSLANMVPSFTAQAFGGDMANQTLQAKLRGLSPNHTLVLINGKRRHTTSSLAILGGPYQGGAGADLNFVPVDSIDHVEVLTEGAAAQYGTDAIAGVINIILKKKPQGGSISVSQGSHYAGDGATASYSGNIGFEATSGSYINLSAEYRDHEHTNRGDIDPRVVDP